MSIPRVSILITTFNSEKYIRESLDSALAQTYPNFEVVVVDGGSTDATREIVAGYKDSRVRPIFSEKRLGIKEGRNVLFKEARGEFLTFLDSDDIYLPEKVAEEAAFLAAHPDYAAVYCDIRYFFDGAPGKFYRHRYTFHSGDIFKELLHHMFITNTAVMFRRSVYDALGGYDETLGMVEDWEYFLRMAHAGHNIGFLPKPLVYYRLRWDNNTNFRNQVPIQESAVKIFENLSVRMSPEEREQYGMEAILGRRRLRLAVAYFAAGKKREACALLQSVRGGFSLRLAAWVLCAMGYVVPTTLTRFFVERAWNVKKKNLFVPV
jgi:glycosyltransferase involved in cell wall biosynthesis